MIELFDMSLPDALQAQIEEDVLATFRTKQFILGERVARFEREYAAYAQAPFAVGVASGTDALVLALRALGIGPGDEVIVPALSFYATAEAVLLVGAQPVLVDVEPGTLNLSPQAAEAAITNKTKALLPVHLYGCPADMPALAALAREHDLKLLEDAAQAAGATLSGRPVGSWGDACCYSFYPTKNLGGAGDGGLVTTPHEAVAERVRLLRVHGTTRAYFHEEVGYTSRLDALQAVVLSAKLPYLDSWNARRRELARYYDARLSDLPVKLMAHGEGVYHLYVVQVEARDRVMAELNAAGIGARAYYPHTLAEMPPLAGRARGELSVARRAAQKLLALPLHPNLSEDDLGRVVQTLSRVLATVRA